MFIGGNYTDRLTHNIMQKFNL